MATLFLAVLPDAAARVAIETAALALRDRFALKGQAVACDRYHLTLHFLGGAATPLQLEGQARAATRAVGEALNARRAGDRAAIVPKTVTPCLDHARSFSRTRPGLHPVVLCSGDDPAGAGLHSLWEGLGTALAAARLLPARPDRFVPHVTVGRDRTGVPVHRITPIRWHAESVILLRGVPGQPYQTLAEWPFPPAA